MRNSISPRAIAGIAALLLVTTVLTHVSAAPNVRQPAEAHGSTDTVDVNATLLLESFDMRDALGTDMESGYVIVRVKVSPKSDRLQISPDDFTLLSRKNGDRADAMAPAQIVSKSALTVRRDTAGREWAQQTNQPGFKGIAGIKRDDSGKDDSALLTALKAKLLPEGESKDPREGLVYFWMDVSKLKAKDLTLLYKGAGGRITIDFK
jgi:hypothetical protein